MDDVPLDDAPLKGAKPPPPPADARVMCADPAPSDGDLWGSAASSSAPPPAALATPFDAFDDFVPSSTSTGLALPARVATTSAVALGSPLLAFSPAAAATAPQSTDAAPAIATATATTTATATAASSAAVDDLLSFSFSPVAAAVPPPMSSSSSSFLMMEDLFLAPTSITASADNSGVVSGPIEATHGPFSGGVVASDAASHGSSFGGFDARQLVESPPAASTQETAEPAASATEEGMVPSHTSELEVPTFNQETETVVIPAVVASVVCEQEDEDDELSLPELSLATDHHVGGSSPRETVQSVDLLRAPESQPRVSFQSQADTDVVAAADDAGVGEEELTSAVAVDAGHETSKHSDEVWPCSSTAVLPSVVHISPQSRDIPVTDSHVKPHWQSIELNASDEIEPLCVSATSAGHEAAVTATAPQPQTVPGSVTDHQEFDEQEGLRARSERSDSAGETDPNESTFHAEAEALYAEVVGDAEDEISRPSGDVHNPVMQLQLRQFDVDQPPSVENSAPSPSSVVSSPGSSVAGSAFAFIAAGASSPFSFGQTVDNSNDEQNEDHSQYDSEHGEGFVESALPAAANEIQAPPSQDDAIFQLDASDADEGGDGANSELPLEESSTSNAEESSLPQSQFGASGWASEGEGGNSGGDDGAVDAVTSIDDFGGFDAVDSGIVHVDDITIESGFDVAPPPSEAFEFESLAPSVSENQASAPPKADDDDDDFGGFAQASNGNAYDDEDDDFGDFGTASAWGVASGANASTSASGFDDDDDDFGSFTPAPPTQQWGSAAATATPSPAPSSASAWASEPALQPIAMPTDLGDFFAAAFPGSKAPYSASLLPKPSGFHSGASSVSTVSILEQSTALHKCFNASLQEYRSMLAGDHGDLHHQQQQQPPFESEAVRLKYLKYVLTEKLNEASRHDGVFPHGSEQYRMHEAIVESAQEKNMRESLARLQEALFHSSVNEAVMRIARQAALSAKARIAEQAAQQQAHARGSLLATTRNFLSRSAGGNASEKDPPSRTGSGSLGVLTPTGASVSKISRFSSSSGQEGESQLSGYGSGEDTGSDVSVGESSRHSGEGDLTNGGSTPPTSASSSSRGGGLMKKFSDRLTSLSSVKTKQRTVSLRRMGQSSEEVCKMELNMESINGGFDEVKWRCAGFLFDTDEVARLAPSQIKIYSYPSNQLLAGKTDRSALSKFFKPGTIWSIDIGVASE